MAAKIQEQLQKEIDVFQKMQKDLQKLVTGRQQLDVQYNENKVVKDELDLVEPDSNVYKLTGPILVKQDLSEAKLNVGKRLDYIQSELKRHEKSITDLQGKQEKKKESLTKLQQQYQQLLPKQAAK
ncbi:prefoldin subunit 6-like [Clytia hemisphaerica]|uniref:Prefoldin subunit 6 n=1 Tax=Clytia hemisphaerica TaxID=252671 RepID=A0A7M5WL84_9CNID